MTSRRGFLRSSALVSAGFLALRGHVESALPGRRLDLYGAFVPDPEGVIDLPEGFSYRVISRTGDEMSDGLLVPGKPDGMAAFEGEDGRVVVVRNHEISNNAAGLGAYGSKYERLGTVDRGRVYDFREGNHLFMGGTSTFVYDVRSRAKVSDYLSLAGTDRNCAGGPTPWGSWVTCEEPQNMTEGAVSQMHGFAFEVPAREAAGLVVPVPLKAMGRFRREAVAVDPVSGVVFQTEDRGDGLITRFIPNELGKLSKGGRLQALVVKGAAGCDTRNWKDSKGDRFPVGQKVDVEWIDIADPLSPKDDMRMVYHKKGAAVFARGEGMWYGEGEIYFACTNGGRNHSGQIFRYVPSPEEGSAGEKAVPGTLELFLESDSTNLLEMCDNLTVAPWGDLVICEDGANEQFLRGVTKAGEVYNLGRNALNGSEFCGACFAPHHPTLFVNIQSPGLTLEIQGPWAERKPLLRV
ncbi:MAG: DUF839 domain-containing protein [Verrucomicrobiales bacterium]|nr:DUF839 domain-containing protein [Verrucomicrobiales bacterium]